MIVEVYHDIHPVGHGMLHVATVNAQFVYDDVDQALEFAFRATQNVDGSWSIYGSPDWNPLVIIHVPLPAPGVGLRSTSVGDQMRIGNRTFYVEADGFAEARAQDRD